MSNLRHVSKLLHTLAVLIIKIIITFGHKPSSSSSAQVYIFTNICISITVYCADVQAIGYNLISRPRPAYYFMNLMTVTEFLYSHIVTVTFFSNHCVNSGNNRTKRLVSSTSATFDSRHFFKVTGARCSDIHF